MKRFLLLFFVFAASCPAFASDTLTRAQIYNFNVGDTFDYKDSFSITQYCPAPCTNYTVDSVSFWRYAIDQIYYSSDSDTLFIVRNCLYPLPQQLDTLVLDSLNFPEIHIDTDNIVCYNYSSFTFAFDSTSSYNNLQFNGVEGHTCNEYINYQYCSGLGKVYSSNLPQGECAGITGGTTLIYYHKGIVTWGTPYTIADSSALIHFTPLPEECATWIGSYAFDYMYKVTTGNRLAQDGHTYVKMLYTDISVTDSVMGYFQNDTVNQLVYFYDAQMHLFLTCDFSKPAGGFVTSISQVNVGGQLRSRWNEDCVLGVPNPGGYIEGVGPATGIFNPNSTYMGCDFFFCGELTCFSVCGQTLYPYDSAANCTIASINNIASENVSVKIYPTANNGQFTAEVTGANLQSAQLLITDITGREIKRCPLNNQLNDIDIQPCGSGLYIWKVLNGGQLLQTGKMVKM